MKGALAEYIEYQLEDLIKTQIVSFIETLDLNGYINSAVEQYFLEYGVDAGAVENNFEQRIARSVQEKLIASNIQWNNYKLSGSLISGGCIEQFGSTGIVDQANDIELVIRDSEIVVENTATVRELNVVENATIEGTLTVNGTITGENDFVDTVRKNVQEQVLATVTEKIEQLQFDESSELKFGKNTMLTKSSLGATVTESNLRSFGIVKELEVSGEASIADTLMVTATGRVGINTMEPDSALTIWDEEIKLSAKKLRKRVGHIGVANQQGLSLGVDDSSDIFINSNQVQINQTLKLKDRSIDYAKTIPGHADVVGSIRFNSQPKAGNYAGWICLGDTRWTGFGKIE